MNTALAPRQLENLSLSQQVVVVTSAARLSARQHAAALLDAGATVVLTDSSETLARETAHRLDPHSRQTLALSMDTRSRSSCERALADCVRRLGKVDLLLNSVGESDTQLLHSEQLQHCSPKLQELSEQFELGVHHAYIAAQVFAAHMATHGGGTILNVADHLLHEGPAAPGLSLAEPASSTHSSSLHKAKLILMTRYLASYWEDEGVRVHALCSGSGYAGQPEIFVRKASQLLPCGRLGSEEQHRLALLFLASDAAQALSGTTLAIEAQRPSHFSVS